MEEEANNAQDKWIEKLIRFFKQLPRKKPDAPEADYSRWHQSEEAYQKEQAEWLAKIRQRKEKKRTGNGECGTE